jgi:6-phosphogluconolactonase (cycloisomerase 2 family)
MGSLWVEVTQGPLAHERFAIDGGLTLGRGEDGAKSLGGDPELSRQHVHFQLAAGGEQLIVEDLESANGTFVNGERIDRPAVLKVGDSIEVGGTTLAVRGDQQTQLRERDSFQPTAVSSAAGLAGGPATPVADPPRAPVAPPAPPSGPPVPPVGAPVPSVPRRGEPRRPPRIVPVLVGLLVLAVAGLIAALLTRTSSSSANEAPYNGTAYVVSNRASPGANSVLAYRYLNGNLSPIRLREYLTGGTGGAKGMLLANDGEGQIATNSSKTLLFAVNQGSDSIAAFHIASDGTLSPVNGSPFNSRGTAPVSLAVTGNTLAVVNKAVDDIRNLKSVPASVATFKINGDGSLSPVGQPAVLSPMSSPSEALLDPSGHILFVPELFTGTMRSFTLGPEGAFRQADASMITAAQASFRPPPGPPPGVSAPSGGPPPGAPTAPPGAPPGFGMQGFAAHPTAPYIYGSLTLTGELVVYSYTSEGKLTFARGVPIRGGIGSCWAAVTPDGRYLYIAETFSDTVAAFDLSDPSNPRYIQTLQLHGMGNVFNIRVDPSSGKQLFVLTARNVMSPLTSNQLHVLRIESNGQLFEATNPVDVPVDTNAGSLGLGAPFGLIVLPHE